MTVMEGDAAGSQFKFKLCTAIKEFILYSIFCSTTVRHMPFMAAVKKSTASTSLRYTRPILYTTATTPSALLTTTPNNTLNNMANHNTHRRGPVLHKPRKYVPESIRGPSPTTTTSCWATTTEQGKTFGICTAKSPGLSTIPEESY